MTLTDPSHESVERSEPASEPGPYAFLAGGGALGALIAARDWSASPIGPIEGWPQSLKTATAILLRSSVPMVMLWGPAGVMIYNDAYSRFAGGRHPQLLGSLVREGWPEIASFNDNVMKVGLAGGTLAYRDFELTLYRNGVPEQVFMNLDYSPVPGENGEPAGVLCILAETTARIESERRSRESADRFRAFVTASASPMFRLSSDCMMVQRLDEHGRLDSASHADGNWISTYLHPEDRALVEATLADAVRRRGEFEMETRAISGEGRYRWINTRGVPILGEDGGIAEWFTVAKDVTERKRNEALRAAQAHVLELAVVEAPLRNSLDTLVRMIEPLLPCDALASILLLEEGRTLRLGGAPSRFRGYPDGIDGRPVDDFPLLAEAVRTRSAVSSVDEPQATSGGADHHDQPRAAWTTPILSATGTAIGLFSIHFREPRDPAPTDPELVDLVTRSAALLIERNAAATRLRLLAALVEQAGDLIGVWRADGAWSFLNRAGRRMLGLDEQADLGRLTIGDFLDARDREKLDQLAANDSEGIRTSELCFRRQDGRPPVPALYSPFAIRDNEGGIVALAAVARDISEQKHNEEMLRRSEERFEAIANSIDQMIWSTRADGYHDYFNERWYQFTGVPAGSSDGDEWNGLFHPDDQQRAWEVWRHCLATGEPYHIEYRLRHRSGEYRWVIGRAQCVRDEAGQILRWYGTCTDVHDLKEAEAALRRSRNRLADERRVLEILNETGTQIAAELDLEHLVQKVVDAGVELTGAQFGAFFYNVRAAGGSYMLYALAGADRAHFERFPMPRATAVFAPTFKGEGVVRSGDIMRDPRYGRNEPYHGMPEGHLPVRSYLAVPVTSRSGEVIGGLFFGHEKKDVFDARSERIMTGLAAQAAIAIDNAQLFEAVQEANAVLEERVRQRTAELETAHEALRQSQKMEAVGQLTGGIAHDFNNMLAVVIGSLDLLSRRFDTSDTRARRYVEAAMDGARRAALVTQRLLAFSRQQPLRPEPIDVNRLVAGMSDLLRHSLGAEIQLETVLAAGLWRTHADPNQLENVILNLAVNSRDAMPGGGRLTIETQNSFLDERYVASVLGVGSGQYVMVAVTDTGTGMPEEVSAKAFDPFFTTKEVGRGTGLGLSQVYGFVKQTGGHVKIYSEPGHGTTVKVYLPRYIGEGIEPAAADEAPGELPRGEMQEVVLVVEDEAAVRQFSIEALTELGYRVLEAPDAAAALRMLEAHPEITLLFTDVVMPDMNGARLAERTRQLRPDVRILFTTGYTRNAVVHNGVLDPGVEMIGKPFTIEELAAKIREVLDAPPRRDG
jgi:PAS domain S-box-containing protein